MSNGFDQAKMQWAQLVSIIQDEMNVGPGGPGTGANTAGRLQTLYDVRQSIDLWTGVYPAAGVQLIECPETPYATRRHKVLSTFHLVVATQSGGDQASGSYTPPPVGQDPNLDHAMAQMQTLLSDGNGNGLLAVLRDVNNFTLGGYAIRTQIRNLKFDWQIKPGAENAAYAYAVVEYIAEALVDI
ncbi:hypothetical protein EPN42_05685 [bacterium]|nr:MAG: hypothetical protein EPN42_05685 [bacterium]